jgi:RNA polymerase sigma factor (sigma-70 family)
VYAYFFMAEGQTTASVQRYLDALGGDRPAEPIVRELLDRAVRRLQSLCANMLHRKYARLTHPPLNLQNDEMLGAVVERLLKALRATRPATVRGFFALANQHMRWELNDLARRLDRQPAIVELREGVIAQPPAPEYGSGDCPSGLKLAGDRLLRAIETLPDEEREVFDLVKIQALSHADAASVLGIATKTVQRRLQRAMLLLRISLQEAGVWIPATQKD